MTGQPAAVAGAGIHLRPLFSLVPNSCIDIGYSYYLFHVNCSDETMSQDLKFWRFRAEYLNSMRIIQFLDALRLWA